MANDRLYVRCVGCGKLAMMDKYYPSGAGLSSGTSYDGVNRLDPFLLRHTRCAEEPSEGGLKHGVLFDLVGEWWLTDHSVDDALIEWSDGRAITPDPMIEPVKD